MGKTRVFGDRWSVTASFKEGGQAWLYRVKDLHGELEGPLLLKRLKNAERLDRFEREIEAAKRLDHPSIAKVLDYSLGDPAYLVTPYFKGRTLEEAAPFDLLPGLKLFRAIVIAVAYAHTHNVVHRDLKPANILVLPQDHPVLIDFGLCYFEDDSGRLTETSEQVGSRFYMAPEFEGGRAQNVTARADSYALGKVLYYTLTRRHLAREEFLGENEVSKVLAKPQALYVTKRILHRSVLVEPGERATASELADQTAEVERLIEEHYYPGTTGSRCRFCGEGTYQPAREVTLTARALGYLNAELPFDCIVCDNCNHVEWFSRKKGL